MFTSDFGEYPDLVLSGADPGWIPWAQSLISAVIGGVLGFLGALGIEGRRERKSFNYGLRLLRDEVVTIAEKAREWAAGGEDEITINPALPTTAWKLLLGSGQLFRLKGALPSVAAFYGQVEEANFLAGQTLSALETAKLASREEDRLLFLQKAIQLSSEPFANLADGAVTVQAQLESLVDGA